MGNKGIYTNSEIQYLKENVGQLKLSTIARNLDRPYDSIQIKLNRLGMGNTRTQSGAITMGELARFIQVDRKTVQGWVERHQLPCTKRITRKSKSFYFIDPLEFWIWAETNKEKIDFSKIEKNVLAPEPSWVEKERAKDKQRGTGRIINYRTWTTKENQRLVQLKEQGLNFVQIATELGRTRESVEKKYKRIIN